MIRWLVTGRTADGRVGLPAADPFPKACSCGEGAASKVRLSSPACYWRDMRGFLLPKTSGLTFCGQAQATGDSSPENKTAQLKSRAVYANMDKLYHRCARNKMIGSPVYRRRGSRYAAYSAVRGSQPPIAGHWLQREAMSREKQCKQRARAQLHSMNCITMRRDNPSTFSDNGGRRL